MKTAAFFLACAASSLSSAVDAAGPGFLLPPDAWTEASAGVVPARDGNGRSSVRVFSGVEPVESLCAELGAPLPGKYLRIEAEFSVREPGEGACDVWRLRLSQPGRALDPRCQVPVVTQVAAHRTVVLEPFYEAEPSQPLAIRLERENGDPRNTFRQPVELHSLRLVPVDPPGENIVVSATPGYNAWPFLQQLGDKLVCAYSRGTKHYFGELKRGVYARTSSDGGKSWSEETEAVNTEIWAESVIGKGLDPSGAALFWVRNAGQEWHHDLYRTTDGVHFERIARIKPEPMPMQITDIIHVPGTGLMSLWFAGTYREDQTHSWGTLVSRDGGKSWEQTVIESGLSKQEWPTEPTAVYLGDGRIFAIARVEGAAEDSTRAFFQLESADSGKTWTRSRTNITDVLESTPSLLLDRGRLYLYYYQRMAGQLKCRSAEVEAVSGKPLSWQAPRIVALGSKAWHHAGNVNALLLGNGDHGLAFYSGDEAGTTIVLKLLSGAFF